MTNAWSDATKDTPVPKKRRAKGEKAFQSTPTAEPPVVVGRHSYSRLAKRKDTGDIAVQFNVRHFNPTDHYLFRVDVNSIRLLRRGRGRAFNDRNTRRITASIVV